jgi:cysteine desulfuration protein SufE
MQDPFVKPEEPTAAEAIEAIQGDLELFDDWMDRYAFIIDLGRKLPPFPAEWQDDAHRVPGCQSKVWMEAVVRDGRMFLAGASDAAIVSGLVALLLRVYSGRRPAEILGTSPEFLRELGLLQNLSSNRGSGIASMAARIRDAAQAVMSPAA